MPIQDLSDQQTRMNNTLSLPMWGRFRKGDEKPERGVGRNLDYFRIDWDDLQAQTAFEAMYGNEPRKLIIATVGHTVDAVFDSWYRLYAGNNALKIKCDGQHIHKAADPNLIGKGCTCNPDNRKCSEQGYLYFTIEDLCKQLGYVGQFMLGTGSFIEIAEFASTLEAVFQTRGTLNFAPFIMQRQNRTFDKTDDQGRPVRYTQSMVQLVPPIEAIFAPTSLPAGEQQSPQLPAGNQGEPEPEQQDEPQQSSSDKWSFEKIAKYLGLATGYSIDDLFMEFYNDDPQLTQSPQEYYETEDFESFTLDIMLRMIDAGIPIRINQIFWDGSKNRHYMKFFDHKIFMFSRDVLREANAPESLINALEKQGTDLMKKLAFTLEELPFMFIEEVLDEDRTLKYFKVRLVRFPEDEQSDDESITDEYGFPM